MDMKMPNRLAAVAAAIDDRPVSVGQFQFLGDFASDNQQVPKDRMVWRTRLILFSNAGSKREIVFLLTRSFILCRWRYNLRKKTPKSATQRVNIPQTNFGNEIE